VDKYLDSTGAPIHRCRGMQLSQTVGGGSHPGPKLRIKYVNTLPINGTCETRPNLHELEIILLGVPFSVFEERAQVGPAFCRIHHVCYV